MKQQARIRIKSTVTREIDGNNAVEIATKVTALQKELEEALSKLPVVVVTKKVKLLYMEEHKDGKWQPIGTPAPTED